MTDKAEKSSFSIRHTSFELLSGTASGTNIILYFIILKIIFLMLGIA